MSAMDAKHAYVSLELERLAALADLDVEIAASAMRESPLFAHTDWVHFRRRLQRVLEIVDRLCPDHPKDLQS